MPPKGRHEPGRRQIHGQVERLLAAGAEAHDHQAEREAACPVTAMPRQKSKIGGVALNATLRTQRSRVRRDRGV